MNSNDIATFNTAVQYARQGYKEKAFDCIKSLAQKEPNNFDLVLWGVYTAPNHDRAQTLLERAKSINPSSAAIVEADLWLTNEMLDLPQPEDGYSLFPPNPQEIINSIAQTTYFAPPQSQTTMTALPPAPTQYAQTQAIYMPPRPNYYPVQPVYVAPAVIAPTYGCPYCRSPYPPLTSTRISTGGWVTFGVLLVFFFPLCWIGLLAKQPYSYCGQCGAKFF